MAHLKEDEKFKINTILTAVSVYEHPNLYKFNLHLISIFFVHYSQGFLNAA